MFRVLSQSGFSAMTANSSSSERSSPSHTAVDTTLEQDAFTAHAISRTTSLLDQEEEFSDSLATSAALVGEVVMDSPQPPHYRRRQQHLAQQSTLDACVNSLAATSTVPDRKSLSRPVSPTPPQLNSAIKLSSRRSLQQKLHSTQPTSAGFMAQGLAWITSQRDKQHRLQLQREAEAQVLKLRKAASQDSESNSESPLSYQNVMSVLNGCTFPETSKSGDGISVSLDTSFTLPATTAGQDEDDPDDDESFIPPVRIEEDSSSLSEYPPILTTENTLILHQIAQHVLPRSIAYSRWQRLYSLARDGDAWDQFMNRAAGHAQTLLLLRTNSNRVLGGFADEVWQPSFPAGNYFGGSTACLFRISDDSKRVIAYPWSGANRYVQFCDHRFLALGGGDGSFGLCLQDDFTRGSTGHCATFDNEPLHDPEDFLIVDLELYGFLLGQF